MLKVIRLAKQQWRSDWKIYAAAMLLTCITTAAYLLHAGYMEQLGASYSRQTKELQLLADIHVELPQEELLPQAIRPTGAWKTLPLPILQGSGRTLHVHSPYGQLLITALAPTPDYSGPLPRAGQALVNEQLAAGLGLPTQGTLVVTSDDLRQDLHLELTGTDTYSGITGHLLLLASDVEPLLKEPGYNLFLYEKPADMSTTAAWSALHRHYTAANICDSNEPQRLAQQTIRDAYQNVGQLILMIFVFLSLGTLTALLLSFLDNKRQLSVLKSLGLRPRELWGLFLVNGLATAGGGIVLGIASAYLLSALLYLQEVYIPIRQRHLWPMLWRTALAYVLAIAVPAGLARRATVNQLLYDQPIPLWSTQVKKLQRRHVAYDDKLAAGWQILRLPVIDGQLEGFLFKEVGDQVKQGEVVAHAPSWWGLAYTEYVAALDGEVALWQEESGFLGIKPHEKTTETD